MAPLRVFSNWDVRPSDRMEMIEPYKKYFLICEGENTEKWYFEQLISDRKLLKIKSTIDLRYVERTEEDLHNSNPVKLIEQGIQIVHDKDGEFEEGDIVVLVFDVDIYKSRGEEELRTIIAKAQANGFLVGVTNPSIELFLLLHVPNSYETHIKPHYNEILENRKISLKRTFLQKLLSDEIHINPKSNQEIASLASKIDIAIEQEKMINQDLKDCMGKITSNIGSIIAKIREE